LIYYLLFIVVYIMMLNIILGFIILLILYFIFYCVNNTESFTQMGSSVPWIASYLSYNEIKLPTEPSTPTMGPGLTPSPSPAPTTPAPTPTTPEPTTPAPTQPLKNLTDTEAQCYLNRYSDLKKEFGTDLFATKFHWMTYGFNEGRDPSCPGSTITPTPDPKPAPIYKNLTDIEAQCYLDRYSDLKYAFKTDLKAADNHWMTRGFKEGRDPSCPAPATQPPETQPPETQPPATQPPETQPPETQPPETQPPETQPPETQPPETQPKNLTNSQAQCYLNRYGDLRKAYGTDLEKAKNHWIIYGFKEGRNPYCQPTNNLTDAEAQCYLNRYANLKDVFGTDLLAANNHWMNYGYKEGKDPSCPPETNTLVVGQSINCSGKDAVFRFMGNNTISLYKSKNIASQWDPEWMNNTKQINCDSFTMGDPLPTRNSYSKRENTDFVGNDIKYYEGPFSNCAAVCDSTTDCKAYTLHKDLGSNCWLKSSASTPTANNSRDTFIMNPKSIAPNLPFG
jgi:hypothetical protein